MYPKLPQSIYQPFRGDEIRLLRINSPLDFTLENTSLSSDTPYVAVSYCWGDVEDTCIVNINQTEALLRTHVANMLGSLYEHHDVHCVWLDMVCINQCNLDEKKKQVSLMGEIYGKAEQVYAWLGESDHEVSGIFTVLRAFRDYRAVENLPEDIDAAECLSCHREKFGDIYEAEIGLLPEPSHLDDKTLHDEFNLLRPFLMVPYWRRVWIVQELILAKRVIVCYGDQSIDFDDIYGLSLDWGPFEQGFDAGVAQIAGRTHMKEHSRAWRIIQAICGHRRARKMVIWDNGEEVTFLPSVNVGEDSRGAISINLLERGDVAMVDEVVGLYAQNKCKLPRDKVYAFRELVPQWKGQGQLEVDYEQKSDLEVFLDVARLGLLEQQNHGGVHVAFWLWEAMGLGDRRTFDDWLRQHFPTFAQ